MRITDSFRTRTVTNNLNNSRERLNDLQEQLATAKRINRPSDDPEGMATALKLKTTLETNEQFQKNIQDSVAVLNAQELALNDIYDIMVQLKEITTEGASDTITVRESLAEQVGLILDNLVEIANTKENGKFLFAGTATLDTPFQVNENVIKFNLDDELAVNYRGNTQNILRQINENTIITVNLDGAEVFDQTNSGGINIFQTVFDLKKDLLNDDTDALKSKIVDIDNGIEGVLQTFLKIGTRKQLVLFNDDRFNSQEVQIRNNLSNIEDTDFGEVFIQFKAEENALNSALSAGARVISPSLLDFLGAV